MLKAVRRHATSAAQGRETHGPTAPSTADPGPGSVSDPRDTTSTSSRQTRRPVVQNADIPPVAFPGGRNPYLDRPLPLPPRPKNASNKVSPAMPARPSTSSGPLSKSAAGTRPNFNKRQSKDDLALNMGSRGKGLQPYIIGVKGSGPFTPESSPGKMSALSSAPNLSVLSRVMTPESVQSGEIPIGMALGSPSQVVSPYAGSWNGSSQTVGYQAQVETNVQRSPSPPPVQKISEPAVQRTKTQKRRLFGFFGRKNSEPAKTMETTEASQSTVSITVTGPAEDNAPTRSKTVSGKKAPKHKPIVIRSNTLETSSQQDSRRTEEQLDGLQPLSVSTPPKVPMLLLDLEIPDVRLERYSIMFSNVLNPNGTTSPQSKSSLLERRQATLEKLKTINNQEEEERIRPRRATSPQPMKSPGFMLFPHAMSSTTSLAPPPPRLMRSNTSPALLPSPARANFAKSQEGSPEAIKKERKTVKIVSPRAMDELNRAAQVEKLREQQQTAEQAQRSQPMKPPTTTMASGSKGFYFGPNNSALILDSPASFVTTSSLADEDYEPLSAKATIVPLRPAVAAREPQWQMISPPSSTTSSPSSKQSVASSVTTRPSLDTLRSLDQKPKVPPVEEADVALKAAVEISIARQISISRQQRSMLRPLGQGATMSSSAKSVAIRGRSATVGVGSGVQVEIAKRTAKLAVPTLVDNGDNRKSELVEVVDP
ncbi:hypothetical protein QBC40DRAFT_192732 [Triangularia verruculosa]|uniref:Uncharacterized protein n=1 Tax=Triangularia verruculosa TaxID=2587418 RepID=A0AAN6XPI6_9PEZI|nr:hypothetical protein QBC40DRAFT_192732 [Triangularia verruculosa]